MLSAASDWHEESEENIDDLKKRRAAERQERWKEKQMHAKFIKQTKNIADDISWALLRNGTLKRETELLITAAQDQCIRTKYIKARIDKTQENGVCCMCGQREETVMHIICECTCQIVDFAIPGDHRVEMKEKEKREKYQDLAKELQVLWSKKVSVIPIVIGALGTVPKFLRHRLHQIGIQTKIDTMQATMLLNMARIIRKVLEL